MDKDHIFFPHNEIEFFVGPFEDDRGMISFAGRVYTVFIFPKGCEVPKYPVSQEQIRAVREFSGL